MAARRSLRLTEGQKSKTQFSTTLGSPVTEKPPGWQLDVSPITDPESEGSASDSSGRKRRTLKLTDAADQEIVNIPSTYPEEDLEDISGLTQEFDKGELCCCAALQSFYFVAVLMQERYPREQWP